MKCAACSRKIADRKQMVTVKTGRLFRRKTSHFHLGCYLDKIKASDIAIAMTKS